MSNNPRKRAPDDLAPGHHTGKKRPEEPVELESFFDPDDPRYQELARPLTYEPITIENLQEDEKVPPPSTSVEAFPASASEGRRKVRRLRVIRPKEKKEEKKVEEAAPEESMPEPIVEPLEEPQDDTPIPEVLVPEEEEPQNRVSSDISQPLLHPSNEEDVSNIAEVNESIVEKEEKKEPVTVPEAPKKGALTYEDLIRGYATREKAKKFATKQRAIRDTAPKLSPLAEERKSENMRLARKIYDVIQQYIEEHKDVKEALESFGNNLKVDKASEGGNIVMTLSGLSLYLVLFSLKEETEEIFTTLLKETYDNKFEEGKDGFLESGGLNLRVIVYFNDNTGVSRGISIENTSYFGAASDRVDRYAKFIEQSANMVKQLMFYYRSGAHLAKFTDTNTRSLFYDVERSSAENIPDDAQYVPVFLGQIKVTKLGYDVAKAKTASDLQKEYYTLDAYVNSLSGLLRDEAEERKEFLKNEYYRVKGYDMPTHLLTFKNISRKLKSVVLFGGYTNVGICLFEAVLCARKLMISSGVFTDIKHDIEAWKNYVYSEFLALDSSEKEIFIDGNYIKYSEKLSEKYGVGVYNYSNGTLVGKQSDYIALVYGGHAYVSSYSMVAGKKMPDETKKKSRGKTYCLEPTPRKAKDSEIRHYHYAYDFETLDSGAGVQNPYLLVVMPINFNGETQAYYGMNCAIDFIFKFLLPLLASLKDEKKHYHHFWAYNGSNFDIHFLIKILCQLMTIEVVGSHLSIKKLKLGAFVEFLDLGAWYLSCYDKKTGKKGLDALAASCACPFKKLAFAHNEVNEEKLKEISFKTKAIEYCTMDCKVLSWLVEKLVIEALDKFEYSAQKIDNLRLFPCSAASLAKKIFELFFCVEKIMGATTPERLAKERRSYRGGLTLALKPMGNKISVYDINSSYPAVMCDDMPTYFLSSNTNKYKMAERVPETWLFAVSEFSFPTNITLPSLMIRGNNGIVLPLTWKAVDKFEYYWGCELNIAFSQGAKIFIEEEHQYKGEKIFGKFIEYFYEKRLEAKRNKEAHLVMFYKILMNSLQGKLGQRDFDLFDIGSIGGIKQQCCDKIDKIKKIDLVNEGAFKITYAEEGDEEKCKRIGSLVRFPSYIAAQGRCKLLSAALPVIDFVAYMDTDSLFMIDGHQLPAEFISETKLGLFKEETEKRCEYGVFFGAKNYMLYKKGDVNIACKGSRFEFNEEYNNFVKEFLGSLFDPLRVAHINSRKLPLFTKRFGSVQVLENYKTIKPTFRLKRIPTSQTTSKPFFSIEEANKEKQVTIPRTSKVDLDYIRGQIKKDAEIVGKYALRDSLRDLDLKEKTISERVMELVYGKKSEQKKLREEVRQLEDQEIKLEANLQLGNATLQVWSAISNELLNLSEVNALFDSIN